MLAGDADILRKGAEAGPAGDDTCVVGDGHGPYFYKM
jgi:hypothetical protein